MKDGTSITLGTNWREVADDLHFTRLKNPHVLMAFETPIRNAVQKFLNRMATSKDFYDPSLVQQAVDMFNLVNQERIVWAHATIFPTKRPDITLDSKMLTAEAQCSRCGGMTPVGSMVKPRGGEFTCFPCVQKLATLKRRQDAAAAKGDRRNSADAGPSVTASASTASSASPDLFSSLPKAVMA
jgi:hypothetical protein